MLALVAFTFQASLMTDPRLDNPTDYDASLVQITDFCAQASQTSHVPLRVDKSVTDLKIDVFVEKRPLRETLDKVAKALNCDWVKDGPGYRLEMSVPAANRERNFVKAEEDEQRRVILTYLETYKYVAERTPPSNLMSQVGVGLLSAEQRNKILDPFRKAYEDAVASKSLASNPSVYDKYMAISSAAGDPVSTGIGRMLLQLDKAATQRFMEGEPLLASTFPKSRYKLYPSDAANNIFASYVDRYGNTRESDKELCYILRYDPVTGMLKCSLNTYTITPKEYGGGGGSSRSGGPFGGSSTRNDISDALKKMPFYQDLATWMDQDALTAKYGQKIDQQTKEWPSIWYSGRRRLGDHLRWFHQATGIPVVAQADRSCLWNWVKLKREFTTASDYLKSMMDNFGTYCKEDSGYLVARNFRFWSHRLHEAPESVWNRIEPADPKKRLTFDQCMAIAGALRDDQLHTEDIGYPLTKFETGRITSGYDCLRFLSVLSPEQRKAAEQGLPASQLNAAQNEAMQKTVLKMVLESGGCSIDMAKYLVANGMQSDVLNRMTFRMRTHRMENYNNWSEDLKDGDEVVVKGGGTQGPVDQIMFTFGFSDTETVGQFLNISL